MALYLQSEQYQTCYFLGKSVAYVQIPMMTFLFPFGQYEEKKHLFIMWPHIFLAVRFLKIMLLTKILKVASLKTNTFSKFS